MVLKLLFAILAVSKMFTIRLLVEEHPSKVTVSSSQGTYIIEVSGESVLSVNGNPKSYFQQTGADRYTITADGLKRTYAGGFTFYAYQGEMFILNYITEDFYLASVVSAEIPGGGLAARKAQAVLARTYAYANMGDHDRGYDLLDSQLSQVYRGLPVDSLSLQAVDETEGLVLGYEEEMAEVYYHSTCGGLTLKPSDVWKGAKDHPYNKRIPDTLCQESPYYSWADTFRIDSLVPALGLERLPDSVMMVRDSAMRPSKGWIFYASDSVYFPYREVASALTHYPRSRRFEARLEGNRLILEGHGYGHGVGMCQFGAMALSKSGANYRDILFHYFPGTEILSLSRVSRESE